MANIYMVTLLWSSTMQKFDFDSIMLQLLAKMCLYCLLVVQLLENPVKKAQVESFHTRCC